MLAVLCEVVRFSYFGQTPPTLDRHQQSSRQTPIILDGHYQSWAETSNLLTDTTEDKTDTTEDKTDTTEHKTDANTYGQTPISMHRHTI